MNNHKILLTGNHKERRDNGKLVELHWIDPNDNRYHLGGYEIQEWSNDKNKYIAIGYFIVKSIAINAFHKYFNQD